MTKTSAMISLDPEIKEECKRLNIKLSPVVNDFLRNFIALKNNDLNSSSVSILKSKLDLYQTEANKKLAEIKELQDKISVFEEREKTKELERLNQEEQKLKEQKTCSLCGVVMENPTAEKEFKKGLFIHKSCFMNLTPEQYNKLDEL